MPDDKTIIAASQSAPALVLEVERAVKLLNRLAEAHRLSDQWLGHDNAKLLRDLAARLPALEADAARWNIVRRGLFVTPHPISPEAPGEVDVVFQSGRLDEIAAKLYHSGALALDKRGIAFDIIPVVDAARARSLGEDTING